MSPLLRYKNSLHRGYLQIILKLACAFKPNKLRHLCLNVGPITDTGIPTCFGSRALNFSEGNRGSERLQKSPSLQRAAEGRVKEWLSPPFPKTCSLHAQKPWHLVTCPNPFFPLLHIHVLYVRLPTPQSNGYNYISNQVLRGFGVLVSSPSSPPGMINPGRYLRVPSGNWAGTVYACRGAVPRWVGNPVRSSRGAIEDCWLVLGPQPRRKITQTQPQLQGAIALCFKSELSTDPIAIRITAFLCDSCGQRWISPNLPKLLEDKN